MPLEKDTQQYNVCIAMTLLSLLVLITIVILVMMWIKPQNLVYDKDLIFKERNQYGSSDGKKASPSVNTEPHGK